MISYDYSTLPFLAFTVRSLMEAAESTNATLHCIQPKQKEKVMKNLAVKIL